MEPLEIIALVLVVITFLKILIISVKQRAWYKFAKSVYSHPKALKWVAIILAVVVGYYLYQAGISIVQFWAVMALTVLLIAIGFSDYSADMLELIEKIFRKKNMLKRARLTIAIWVVLGLWLLKELFL